MSVELTANRLIVDLARTQWSEEAIRGEIHDLQEQCVEIEATIAALRVILEEREV